ncbi:hypothetical protein CC86DRAFT_368874 [Ophiobolus disseminans]|uniref:Uncharacterized protein n=1 Tax=Ophiobolus disseminans TaxID=1469910 RepID=A0A6A7A7G2_9PLEO|nr:hypothetical protein CC86DRAFT_368874 [Ophiobolus disseminans]
MIFKPETAAAHADHTMVDIIKDFLQGLNPYIDDLVCLPIFHQFKDLPLELRYKVYEPYFLDDSKAVSSRMWPVIAIDDELYVQRYRRKKPKPFLTHLCIVNHAIMAETIVFMAGFATFQLHKPRSMRPFAAFLRRPSICKGSRFIASIRKLHLSDMNDLLATFMNTHLDSRQAREDQAISAYQFVSQNLDGFAGVHTLPLALHAPTLNFDYIWHSDHEAVSINRFIQGFDMRCLIALE